MWLVKPGHSLWPVGQRHCVTWELVGCAAARGPQGCRLQAEPGCARLRQAAGCLLTSEWGWTQCAWSASFALTESSVRAVGLAPAAHWNHPGSSGNSGPGPPPTDETTILPVAWGFGGRRGCQGSQGMRPTGSQSETRGVRQAEVGFQLFCSHLNVTS